MTNNLIIKRKDVLTRVKEAAHNLGNDPPNANTFLQGALALQDAATEIESLRAEVKGLPKARKCMASATSDPPQDCDAPFCGCDPAWSACIEMLQECNLLIDRRSHVHEPEKGHSGPYCPATCRPCNRMCQSLCNIRAECSLMRADHVLKSGEGL
jgi:hypothetical protein